MVLLDWKSMQPRLFELNLYRRTQDGERWFHTLRFILPRCQAKTSLRPIRIFPISEGRMRAEDLASPFHTACRTPLKLQELAQTPLTQTQYQPVLALGGVASLGLAWVDL